MKVVPPPRGRGRRAATGSATDAHGHGADHAGIRGSAPERRDRRRRSIDEHGASLIAACSSCCTASRPSCRSIVLLLSIALFSALVGRRFFTPVQLVAGAAAGHHHRHRRLAQTLVILTAGIDLSVGAIMVLASVVMGRLAINLGVPVSWPFPLGLLLGLACGMVNGGLVTLFSCRRSSSRSAPGAFSSR